MLHERGITKKNSKRQRGRNKAKLLVTLQIDKSTCLSYNFHKNEYGYNGVPTQAMKDLLDEISHEYAVEIQCDVQPTHTFDLNAQDAMYHAELKRQLRFQGYPDDNDDLREKFATAVDNISLNSIQRGFIRAYSKDKTGDENMEMIPESLLGWYSDEEMTSDDENSDLNVHSEETHTDEE